MLNNSHLDRFSRWFGHSKVVDGQGSPLVVYHGTHAYERDGVSFGNPVLFDRTFAQKFFGRKPSYDHVGSWFTTDSVAAASYGPAVMPVYLRIESPLIITGDGANAPQWATRRLMRLVEEYGGVEEFRESLSTKHDGILIQDDLLDGLPGDVWVALHPNQIKSAICNCGSYDLNNPRIDDGFSPEVIHAPLLPVGRGVALGK